MTSEIPKLAATIQLSTTKLNMTVNQVSSALKVTSMANGDSVASFTSSNNKIVKVLDSTSGKLQAVKAGNATITAKLKSGATATCNVTVSKITTKKLKLNKKSLKLKKGKKATLKVTVTPKNSQDKVTFKSSNKKIATVNSKGVVKAIRKRKTKITVKSGKKKVVCKITVK
jgi:uncharacterized protein YjdB